MRSQIKNIDEVSRINLAFGDAMLLFGKSALHSSWSIDMATRNVLPAILSRQFMIMKDENGIPLAYVSWAWFDLRREALYLESPHSITSDDWRCGDRLWFIDWISPINKAVTQEFFNKMTRDVFPSMVARSLRVKASNKAGIIKSYAGNLVSLQEKQLVLTRYRHELETYLNGMQNKIKF